jgi:amphi-Trp domain-containing protein
MADVKLEHTVTSTRQDAARWIADLAAALAANDKVTLDLSGSTVELKVPDLVRWQAEVEVDGDEVELELELTWSTARRSSSAVPAPATSEEAAPQPAGSSKKKG